MSAAHVAPSSLAPAPSSSECASAIAPSASSLVPTARARRHCRSTLTSIFTQSDTLRGTDYQSRQQWLYIKRPFGFNVEGAPSRPISSFHWYQTRYGIPTRLGMASPAPTETYTDSGLDLVLGRVAVRFICDD
ncbi:hypothetical protein EV363DRAFT_1164582 [Boletus edulis]|uniref:Uncharacterized protein n=1 Tax=Boletus edulis BED1 TaxID=1328754 RepID=A0AAD4BHJ7_BOLED|nr:hypothetical protein EV363DRAFT_1164582 [Boletus edulis]KAF8430684.1 hypothetical protein L210DRAFT_977150 [Boletus edulis BED1]